MRKIAASSVLIRVANTALGFGVAVLLARALGPSGYGIYAFVFAIVSIMAIPAQFGIPHLIVRETARAKSADDFETLGALWKWSAYLVALLSLLFAGIAVLLGFLLSDSLSSEQVATFLWGLLLLPLLALGVVRGAALRGLGYVLLGQLPELVLRPAFFLTFLFLTLFAIKATVTPHLAMALHAAGAFIAFIIGASFLWRLRPSAMHNIASPSAQDKKVWIGSLIPLAAIGGLHVMNNQIGLLLVGTFRTESEVGIYRVATQLGVFVGFGLQAVNMVVGPQFSRLYRENQRARLQKAVRDSARLSSFIALPIGALFILGGIPILRYIFGADYVGAHGPLVVLAFGQISSSMVGSVGLLLNMTGHERRTMRAVTASAVVNLAISICLIPYIGSYGAAIGATVALIVWNWMLYRSAQRYLGITTHAFS